MTNTVLVLGARGRLGGAVAQAFAAAGWRVLAQRRAGGAAQPVALGADGFHVEERAVVESLFLISVGNEIFFDGCALGNAVGHAIFRHQ